MKTKNFKIAGVVLSLTMSLASFSGAMANDEQYLNSDPIDINGYVKPQVEATDQELETIRGDVRQAKQINHINKSKTKGYKNLLFLRLFLQKFLLVYLLQTFVLV